MSIEFANLYPGYFAADRDGETGYFVVMQVGGKDENGEYELVLEGPAAGEKVYLDESYG